MWPDPRDLLLTGSKLYMNHLIIQSAQALGQSQPIIAVCENPTASLVQDILDGKIDGVLKREYSSDSTHVYTKHTQNAVKKFKKALEDERKFWHWDNQKICENPKWFIQPYIPSFLYLGELRAFVANGIIVNVVVSTPENPSSASMAVSQVVLIRPLCNIRYSRLPISYRTLNNIVTIRLTKEDSESSNRTWLADPTLSPLETDHCFEKYVLEMLEKIVAADEFHIKRRSQFRIFCRFDVGVFKSQATGKFHYMMNELTPCHTTGLFVAWDQSHRMEIFFQEMAKTLHFLTSEFKPSLLTPSPSPGSSGLEVWLYIWVMYIKL